MTPGSSARRISSIATAGADQALLSVVTFAVGLLAARRLDLSLFGRYTTAYAFAFLLSSVHAALVLEPVSVFAHGRFRSRRQSYLSRWTKVHLFVGAGGLALGAAALMASSTLLGVMTLGSGLMAQGFVRRRAYVDGLTTPSLAVTLVAAMCIAASAMILPWHNPADVLAYHGLSLSGSSIIGTAYLQSVARIERSSITLSWRESASAHFGLGGWYLVTSLLFWVSTYGVFPVVEMVLSAEATARLRVAQLMFMPVSQGTTALTILETPRASAAMALGGAAALRRRLRSFSVWVRGPALGYVLVATGLSDFFASMFGYAGDIGMMLVLSLAVAAFADAYKQTGAVALAVLEQSRQLATARTIGFIVSVAGYVLLAHRPSLGLAAGIYVLSAFVTTVAVGLAARRSFAAAR